MNTKRCRQGEIQGYADHGHLSNKIFETAGDCWKVLEHRWLFNSDLIEDREWGNVPAVTGL